MMVTQATQPKVVRDFPHKAQEIEHVWVPMADGTRLSARFWMPEDAGAKPVPAILEYIPYRKLDGTRAWDDPRHRWWAGHGYAAIRLDIRGTGESEGTITDEHTPQEQQDAVESAHVASLLPDPTLMPGMDVPMMEYDTTENLLLSELLTQPLTFRDGGIVVPEGPGQGVDIDMAFAKKYRVDQ